ncbi:MAG: transposase [Microcystaceae cyanobacterium]
MSFKKLNEEDKNAILELYRQTVETTSTLADRFGISSSTVSRFLKASLSETEYDNLIQQKRLARGHKGDSQLALTLEESSKIVEAETPVRNTDKPPLLIRSRKRKSSAPEGDDSWPTEPETSDFVLTEGETAMGGISFDFLPRAIAEASIAAALANASEMVIPVSTAGKPVLRGELAEPKISVPQISDLTDFGAIVKDLDDDLNDLLDDDDLDDLEEDPDDLEAELEEEDSWEGSDTFMPRLNAGEEITVLPLKSAVFPLTCYIVIDRTSELIVRPLKEFAHLGKVPADEVLQKTLPVFDSHHVARRFSHRTQRVIKVPDSQILYKTSSHLQAKGITRIFLDGQVFALDRN